MIDNRRFLDFALGNTDIDPKGQYMKLIHNGITYIYAPYSGVDVSSDYGKKAEMVGLVCGKSFYGCSYPYGDIDKNFRTEVINLMTRYYELYNKEIEKFSPDNLAPITENTVTAITPIAEKLEYYKKYDALSDASNSFFRSNKTTVSSTERGYAEFSNVFLDYLVNGEKVLYNLIACNIEKNAESINYRILAKVERDKHIEKLKINETFMRRVNLFHILDESDMRSVKLTLDVDGTVIKDLIANADKLAFSLTGDYISEYMFTKNEINKIKKAWNYNNPDGSYRTLNLTIDNIIKITYGKKVIYERK